MTVVILASALIRVFEGLRLSAYQDGGGVWTIGYGHTREVKVGDTCTAEQAQSWFAADSAELFEMVKNEPLAAAAAYVSFGYNCGARSLDMALQGDAKLSAYIHDRKGNVEPGLVSRRELEQALIDSCETPRTT